MAQMAGKKDRRVKPGDDEWGDNQIASCPGLTRASCVCAKEEDPRGKPGGDDVLG